MKPPSPYKLLKHAAETGQLVQVPSSRQGQPSNIFASVEAAETLLGLGFRGLRGVHMGVAHGREKYDLSVHSRWVSRQEIETLLSEKQWKHLLEITPLAPSRDMKQGRGSGFAL